MSDHVLYPIQGTVFLIQDSYLSWDLEIDKGLEISTNHLNVIIVTA